MLLRSTTWTYENLEVAPALSPWFSYSYCHSRSVGSRDLAVKSNIVSSHSDALNRPVMPSGDGVASLLAPKTLFAVCVVIGVMSGWMSETDCMPVCHCGFQVLQVVSGRRSTSWSVAASSRILASPFLDPIAAGGCPQGCMQSAWASTCEQCFYGSIGNHCGGRSM